MEGSASELWKYLVGIIICKYVSIEEKLALILVDIKNHAHSLFQMMLKFRGGEMCSSLMDKFAMATIFSKLKLFDMAEADDDQVVDAESFAEMINSLSNREVRQLWRYLIDMQREPQVFDFDLDPYDETSGDEYSSDEDSQSDSWYDSDDSDSSDESFSDEYDSWYDSDRSDELSADDEEWF